MAAKYDFKTSPDIQGEKEQPTLYPQIVVSVSYTHLRAHET